MVNPLSGHENFVENDLIRKSQNLNQFQFLKIDEDKKVIVIRPGIWDLKKNMIIYQ